MVSVAVVACERTCPVRSLTRLIFWNPVLLKGKMLFATPKDSTVLVCVRMDSILLLTCQTMLNHVVVTYSNKLFSKDFDQLHFINETVKTRGFDKSSAFISSFCIWRLKSWFACETKIYAIAISNYFSYQ